MLDRTYDATSLSNDILLAAAHRPQHNTYTLSLILKYRPFLLQIVNDLSCNGDWERGTQTPAPADSSQTDPTFVPPLRTCTTAVRQNLSSLDNSSKPLSV